MIIGISSLNTTETKYNIKKKQKNNLQQNTVGTNRNFLPGFNGYLFSLVQNSNRQYKALNFKSNNEEQLKRAKFLSEDASLQYSNALNLFQNIKQEITAESKEDGNLKIHRKLSTDNGQKSIVTALYSSNNGEISINRIDKLYANGSYDILNFDENGKPTLITNGIVNVSSYDKLISEKFFYDNGLLKKVQLGVRITPNNIFVSKEILYDNGTVTDINENFNKKMTE